MKRSLLARIGAVAFSLTLIAVYVGYRVSASRGATDDIVEPAGAMEAEPMLPGTKSAAVFVPTSKPAHGSTVLPGSKDAPVFMPGDVASSQDKGQP
jgi:hypothetical protein